MSLAEHFQHLVAALEVGRDAVELEDVDELADQAPILGAELVPLLELLEREPAPGLVVLEPEELHQIVVQKRGRASGLAGLVQFGGGGGVTEEQSSLRSITLKYLSEEEPSGRRKVSSPSKRTCFFGFSGVAEVNLLASWKVSGETSRKRSKIDIGRESRFRNNINLQLHKVLGEHWWFEFIVKS